MNTTTPAENPAQKPAASKLASLRAAQLERADKAIAAAQAVKDFYADRFFALAEIMPKIAAFCSKRGIEIGEPTAAWKTHNDLPISDDTRLRVEFHAQGTYASKAQTRTEAKRREFETAIRTEAKAEFGEAFGFQLSGNELTIWL